LRNTRYIFVVSVLALFVGPIAPQAWADPASSKEYQIKAAFLYNFIKFVDWPKEKLPDANEPITIGIIGKDPFGKAFEPVKDKKVKGKRVVVKRFKSMTELKQGENDKADLETAIETLRKCHLLFVCASEQKHFKEITKWVKDHSVLTVGDTKGFLEFGGIINFLVEDKKVRFEINAAAAKQAKLKIRSQLLRLAKKVIK